MTAVTSAKTATPSLWRAWALGILVLAASFVAIRPAQAQLRVDISGVGATQYPIAIADFTGDGQGQAVAEVIRADLTRSGQFKLINATGSTAERRVRQECVSTFRSRGSL